MAKCKHLRLQKVGRHEEEPSAEGFGMASRRGYTKETITYEKRGGTPISNIGRGTQEVEDEEIRKKTSKATSFNFCFIPSLLPSVNIRRLARHYLFDWRGIDSDKRRFFRKTIEAPAMRSQIHMLTTLPSPSHSGSMPGMSGFTSENAELDAELCFGQENALYDIINAAVYDSASSARPAIDFSPALDLNTRSSGERVELSLRNPAQTLGDTVDDGLFTVTSPRLVWKWMIATFVFVAHLFRLDK
ncbi:hypothetical protein BDZ89DRAFT_1123930 [Hymenopellis radicata]|nr:hypothetical protein BDZ89DRAFT_1123930 [Hymenopellis radicata]